MLFLNTFHFQKDLKDQKLSKEFFEKIAQKLAQTCEPMLSSTALRSGRELLFDVYMAKEEWVFSRYGISRIFDFRQESEENLGPQLGAKDQLKYQSFLISLDQIWQHTQAPIAELVKAGKYQLEKHNGAATYKQLESNAHNMPELFAATKELVDSYLNTDILFFLIDRRLRNNEPVEEGLWEVLKKEVCDFAGRSLKFGFWHWDRELQIPLLDDLEVDSFALPQ